MTFINFERQGECLNLGVIIVGLETKLPLEYNIIFEGLNYIREQFPTLSESEFEEKDKKIILKNNESEVDKQVYFRITSSKRFEYMWGPLVKFDFQSQIKKFFNSIEKGFKLYPINVNFIDLKFYVISEWQGHHYKAIWETFMSNTPFANIFESKNILQDDLFLRSMLDDSRICIIGIESDVNDKEILSGKFENNLLKVYTGIAQTRKIPIGTPIADTFIEHANVAINFINSKFIPNVVEPLDKVLSKLCETKRGKNDHRKI